MRTLLLSCVVLVLGFSGVEGSQQYDDLVKLVKSGANEEVVLAFIDASNSGYALTPAEIVQLKDAGASSRVIVAAIQHKKPVKLAANTGAAPSAAGSKDTSTSAQAAPSNGAPSTQPAADEDKILTVNVPNANGTFTAVKLTRHGKGFLGPQGEFYVGHPTMAQLKVLYGD